MSDLTKLLREALRNDEYLSNFMDPDDKDYIAALLSKVVEERITALEAEALRWHEIGVEQCGKLDTECSRLAAENAAFVRLLCKTKA